MSNVFLKRIPDAVYHQIADTLHTDYHFLNGAEQGGRMRLANYYVGIRRGLADLFVDFIQQVVDLYKHQQLPEVDLPAGFAPVPANMTEDETNGGFSLGSFDMAVTENALQSIEFQAIATYPFTAARLNWLVQQALQLTEANIFVNHNDNNWDAFVDFYQTIFAAKSDDPIILTDRKLKGQKTSFEFYATQKELGLPVQLIDVTELYTKDNRLFFDNNEIPQQVHRLYNRVLPSEAIYDDAYPDRSEWRFRYDVAHEGLTYISHPSKLFEVSKRLLPYIKHPFNPIAAELESVAPKFLDGSLKYQDYVWKHKEGAAGFSLILSPNEAILKSIIQKNELSHYIAQQKIHYKKFITDDGQEKIIELRFLTAHQGEQMHIIPMARIGHCEQGENGAEVYKIHFGDNNRMGYGFAPVLVFD